MPISDKNAAKGLRFLCRVADVYEETMEENSTDQMTEEQRARLGMAFAAYANGVVLKDLGLIAGTVCIIRSILAARKTERLLRFKD